MGEDLSPAQKQDLEEVILQHQDVFSELPGRTTITQHGIKTAPGITVRVPPYRVPEAWRNAIREEVTRMLRLRVIEESRSAWSSPVVLVPKPDGTFRFCNDFRKLNEVSEFDAYPMPRVDELIERPGSARYLTTLDLTKGGTGRCHSPGPLGKKRRLQPRGYCISTRSCRSVSTAPRRPSSG